MKQTFVSVLLASLICITTRGAGGEIPAFLFDWASVAGDVDFTKPVHSSFAFTKIFGGGGAVSCLQGLPDTESVAGNPPVDLEFVFGSGGSLIAGDPALSLTGFDNSGRVVVQKFTATPDNALEVFDRGIKVAHGVVLDVTVLTPPSLLSTGYGHFQLTDNGGGDPTIFNELLEASGNTGILSFSLASFEFSGTSTNPALFVAEGLGAPGTPPSLNPTNPLWPASSADGFVFDIPAFPTCPPPPRYFDPEVTLGYDYEATGTSFASLILPDIGDGSYDLFLWNGSDFAFEQVLIAGEEFDFGGMGVDRFRILGIEAAAGLDPTNPLAFVTGLRFTSTNAASMTMTPIVPDANFDGDSDVDGSDFLIWQRGFGLTDQTENTRGDADRSGAVDGDDLLVWESQFGTAGAGGHPLSPVPESGSLVLLVAGLVVALGLSSGRLDR